MTEESWDWVDDYGEEYDAPVTAADLQTSDNDVRRQMLFRWLHRRSKQFTQEKACICGDLQYLHGRDEDLYSKCMEEVSAEVAAIVVPPLPNAPVEMRGTTFLGGGASRLSPEYIQHAR